jgi:hypothetical protein
VGRHSESQGHGDVASHHVHHHHEGCDHHEPSSPSFLNYDCHGVRFRFPGGWAVSEQSEADQTTISVQSDGTSFWSVTLMNSRPDLEMVLDAVVDAFEQDYDEVDVISAIGSLGGFPSLGRELDFVCYDLVNSASVRAFQTPDQTVMVLYQGTDKELDETRSLMEGISASLVCDDIDDFDADEYRRHRNR